MSVLATTAVHPMEPLRDAGLSDEVQRTLRIAFGASPDEDNRCASSSLTENTQFDPSLLEGMKQEAPRLSPLRDANTIRLLVVLNARPGGWSIRTLAVATGMSKSSVERAVTFAETEGLLEVDHGRSNFDPDGPRMNEYRVTRLGSEAIPEVLLDSDLVDDFSLQSPVWHQTDGYGLVGLVLCLELMRHGRVTTRDIATMLGTSPRSAANIMKRLMRKGGYLLKAYDGWYEINEEFEPKHWASVDMEEKSEARQYADRLRRAKLCHFPQPEERVRTILALEPHLVRWVHENVSSRGA